jgi:hypothetical protein
VWANSNRRGVQQWWFSPVEGMVVDRRRKSDGGRGPLVLGMDQTVSPDGWKPLGALDLWGAEAMRGKERVECSTAARLEQRGGKGREKEAGACQGAWPLNKKKKCG